MSERVAAIDCGTNSIRLLVAERFGDGFVEVDRRLTLTRLGQGVDATGEFHPDALARTLAAAADYAEVMAELGVGRRRFVATSAARDARNRDEFFAGVRRLMGVDAEIISGDEEARLSFAGAVSMLTDVASPVVVMDIGGGSTELVHGTAHDHDTATGVSLDIGSVRVRERFLVSDPPTADEISAAESHIDALLLGCGIDLGSAATWIGVGGTATSLSAIIQGLDVYDRSRVHGSVIRRSDLDASTRRLLSLPVSQVLKIPTMEPGRADVICAGALICQRVGHLTGRDLLVSEADILDGIVADLLDSA